MRRAVLLAAAAACGGSGAPAPAPSVRAVSLAAPASGADDAVVAQVNGRPVWASCVAAQAAAARVSASAALAQCVDFELLAQAAEARGLARDPDAEDAARGAAANRLVELDFERRYAEPPSLAAEMDKQIDAAGADLHQPELRGATFVRVAVPAGAAFDVDAKAKAVADQIYAELSEQTGLFGADLVDAASRHADTGLAVASSSTPAWRPARFEAPFAAALFAIPEIGRVAPPARTRGGWDVILWTDVRAPKDWTREELYAGLFPETRRNAFVAWVSGLARAAHMQIELDEAGIALLDPRDPVAPKEPSK